MICIDDLDFNAIVELEKIIESGGHIGIMGDRVALSNTKNVKVDFLGKPCYFPVGAYFIAGICRQESIFFGVREFKGSTM